MYQFIYAIRYKSRYQEVPSLASIHYIKHSSLWSTLKDTLN